METTQGEITMKTKEEILAHYTGFHVDVLKMIMDAETEYDATFGDSIKPSEALNAMEAYALQYNEGLVKALEEYVRLLSDCYNDAFSVARVHHYAESQERIDRCKELREQIKALASPSAVIGTKKDQCPEIGHGPVKINEIE